jgi:hypothetical protein
MREIPRYRGISSAVRFKYALATDRLAAETDWLAALSKALRPPLSVPHGDGDASRYDAFLAATPSHRFTLC